MSLLKTGATPNHAQIVRTVRQGCAIKELVVTCALLYICGLVLGVITRQKYYLATNRLTCEALYTCLMIFREKKRDLQLFSLLYRDNYIQKLSNE